MCVCGGGRIVSRLITPSPGPTLQPPRPHHPKQGRTAQSWLLAYALAKTPPPPLRSAAVNRSTSHSCGARGGKAGVQTSGVRVPLHGVKERSMRSTACCTCCPPRLHVASHTHTHAHTLTNTHTTHHNTGTHAPRRSCRAGRAASPRQWAAPAHSRWRPRRWAQSKRHGRAPASVRWRGEVTGRWMSVCGGEEGAVGGWRGRKRVRCCAVVALTAHRGQQRAVPTVPSPVKQRKGGRRGRVDGGDDGDILVARE